MESIENISIQVLFAERKFLVFFIIFLIPIYIFDLFFQLPNANFFTIWMSSSFDNFISEFLLIIETPSQANLLLYSFQLLLAT